MVDGSRPDQPADVQASTGAVSLFAGACAVASLGAAVALALWGYSISRSADVGLAPTVFIGATLLLIAGIGVPTAAARERHLRAKEENDCRHDCDQLEAALRNIDDKTLSGLAIANFRQMRMFTLEAIRQARRAAYACLAAAWVSLMVLVFLAGAAMVPSTTDARIVAAVLTAVGAALSGFITSVFMKSYSMAARQMSFYYGQPLVHCYLLHAEWLAESLAGELSAEQRWQVLRQVIDASVSASEGAQRHLLQLQVDGRPPRLPTSSPQSRVPSLGDLLLPSRLDEMSGDASVVGRPGSPG